MHSVVDRGLAPPRYLTHAPHGSGHDGESNHPRRSAAIAIPSRMSRGVRKRFFIITEVCYSLASHRTVGFLYPWEKSAHRCVKVGLFVNFAMGSEGGRSAESQKQHNADARRRQGARASRVSRMRVPSPRRGRGLRSLSAAKPSLGEAG